MENELIEILEATSKDWKTACETWKQVGDDWKKMALERSKSIQVLKNAILTALQECRDTPDGVLFEKKHVALLEGLIR